MKKNLFTMVALAASMCYTTVFAQVGHLTIFSEEGDKFFLSVNGEQQNNVPMSNVRIEDLTQPQYSVKIVFENQMYAGITKTLFLADESGVLMDVTYKMKHDKNGNPKLGAMPFSFTPVRQGFVAPANVYVVHYGVAPPAPSATTTVTQTSTTQTNANTNTVSANVNMGGVNMNVSINDPLMNSATETTTTYSTTTTTTASPAEHIHETKSVGCFNQFAMSSANFSSALEAVKKQGFDETRLKTAKQIASANCLSTTQISEICKVFGFEETKLDFAKYAYQYCTEPKNYFKINNIFSFSSSVDELTEFIQAK